MISTLVVDDEPLARELMGGYVRQTPFLSLAGSCPSAVETLSVLREKPVDLLFLDIQMPHMNGVELSRIIDPRTKVVFTTAFEQYALEGFRVDALDYLLKPVSYAEFMRAATRARRWFEGEPVSPASSGADASARGIFVRADYKMVRLLLDDILYIEGMKDYVRIHTQQEPVTTQMSMKAIEESLPDGQFVRVHRSYIVNIDKVRTIDRNRIVFDRVYIPISDMYREHFMQLLSKHSLLL